MRRLAKEVGFSSASVHRIWQKYEPQRQQVETFKFSTHPDFDRKLTNVAGLYTRHVAALKEMQQSIF